MAVSVNAEPGRKVFVDGETVTFNGPCPTDLTELVQLVESVLHPQGRRVTGCRIDGESFAANPESIRKADWKRLEIETLDRQTLIQNEARAGMTALTGLIERARSLGVDLLDRDWQDALAEVTALGAQLDGFFQLVRRIRGIGLEMEDADADAVADCLNAMDGDVEALVSAVRKRDLAGASDAAALGLLPNLTTFNRILQGFCEKADRTSAPQ